MASIKTTGMPSISLCLEIEGNTKISMELKKIRFFYICHTYYCMYKDLKNPKSSSLINLYYLLALFQHVQQIAVFQTVTLGYFLLLQLLF